MRLFSSILAQNDINIWRMGADGGVVKVNLGQLSDYRR